MNKFLRFFFWVPLSTTRKAVYWVPFALFLALDLFFIIAVATTITSHMRGLIGFLTALWLFFGPATPVLTILWLYFAASLYVNAGIGRGGR